MDKEQTKVEDILMMIKKKIWVWVGHIMHRIDNRLTKKVTEWQPRNSKRTKRQAENQVERQISGIR